MSVNNRDMFGFASINLEGKRSVSVIRNAFNNLMDVLENECPAGREFSIVQTNLQTACMYAIRATSFSKPHRNG